MTTKDFYQILEVDQNADLDAIKKAFRKKAAQYHPDINPNPEAKAQFEAVIEAFDVLGDEENRKTYDSIRNRQTALEPVLYPEDEIVFEEWETKSKKRAKKYSSIGLEELLMLDIMAGTGMIEGLLDSSGDIIDSAADALDGLFDLF